MDKEYERIDGNVVKNDPPVIINKGHPKVKTKVDASCNVFCIMHFIFILWSLQRIVYTLVVWVCV